MRVSFTFGADLRDMQGKGASRRLRHKGKVPAILYGGHQDAQALILDQQNLLEGPSTRLLIYAGRMMAQGVAPRRACDVAIVQAMTDDPLLAKGVRQVVEAVFT